jgi:hypothetical protein
MREKEEGFTGVRVFSYLASEWRSREEVSIVVSGSMERHT